MGLAAAGLGLAVGLVVLSRRRKRAGARGLAPALQAAITVDAPAETIYALWRDPQTQARIRRNYRVTSAEDGRSWHWERELLGGRIIEGDGWLQVEDPPRRLEWEMRLKSRMAAVQHGTLELEPHTDGSSTEVRLTVLSQPPMALGPLRRGLDTMLRSSLRRFKQLAETGEIATTRGQASGTVQEPRAHRPAA
ncbi:MAG: SRPBCC family protein [Terriglobales bacterium]